MATSAEPHPVPTGRLHELLGGWSGEGTLSSSIWADLAAVRSEDDTPLAEQDWSEQDVTRRAHRVLLERLTPDLERWPRRLAQWQEALPATTRTRRVTGPRPLRPTDWPQTARRHGWPPTTFIGRQRSTLADELLLTTLRWTVPQMLATFRHAERVLADAGARVRPQVSTAARLLDEHIGGLDDAPAPTAADLAAVARAGYPWNVLAPVATAYVRYGRHMRDLASELIYPLDSLRWRLFHIGVLGEVLGALRDEGATLTWRAPLSAGGGRPQYRAEHPMVTLEVWFEAAGVWALHKSPSAYREALDGLPSRPSSIGPDILLLDPLGRRALVIECKYGDARYVGRNGYLQSVAYADELRVAIADEVWSYVVGPSGVVDRESHTVRHGVHGVNRVGVSNPEALQHIVRDFLGSSG